MRGYARLGWVVLVLLLLPLEVAGLFALGVSVYGLVRYDPAYFDQAHVERFSSPQVGVRALEVALQTDNQALLAELQGLRWPSKFETGASLSFVMLWERSDRYTTYLYFDEKALERHPHYFEKVRGRWVVAPPDLYYYVHSGQWRRVFWPVAISWWVLGAVAVGIAWLFRALSRGRADLYGEE